MPPTLSTTTNNSFRFPTNANNGTDFATGIGDLASDVDGMWLSGTLAARPAAGTRNRRYYATDTGLFYLDTGAAWQTMLVAGAWQTITLGSGIGTGTAHGGYTASARTEGDLVRLKGILYNTTGSSIAPNTTLATLPSGTYPPSQTVGLPALLFNAAVAVTMYISFGPITLLSNSLAAGERVVLDGITFTLS